ncbi:MAG: phage baseplate assembly protein V [Chloroflexota bacterium]
MSEERVYGVVLGQVKDVNDPQGEGRVQVEFPWMGGKSDNTWAPVASLMAGNGRGAWFMPEVGDEVLVAFDHGDVKHPYVIGFLWSGKDNPPYEHVRERAIRSVNGHAIRLLDSTPEGGSLGAVVIEDAHGNRITLSNGKIKIQSVALLEIEAPVISLGGPGYRRVVTPSNNPI